MSTAQQRLFPVCLLCFFLFGASQYTYAQGGIDCSSAQLVQAGIHQTDGLNSGRGASRTDAIHARWFRFIPPQSGLLSIGSCGQPADTRLQLYRGHCDDLTPIAQSDDACDTDANPATPNTYAASVNGLFISAHDTLFIEWDDHWDNNGFSWELAFQKQEADGQLLPAQRLVQVPLDNYPQGYPLRVLIGNRGASSLYNITVLATVANQVDSFVFTDSVLINELSGGAPLEVSMGWFPLEENQQYDITYVLSANEDRFRENDTLRQSLSSSMATFSVTNREQGALGGVASGSSWFGQAVQFDQDERLRGLSFSRSGGRSGDSLFVHIYPYQESLSGAPDTTLGPWLLDGTQPERQLLDFGADGLTLSGAPNWLFALEHRSRGQRLFVDYQPAQVGQGEAWTRLGPGDWQTTQEEGLDIDFSFRWHTSVPRTEFTLQLTMPDSLQDSDPLVQIYRPGRESQTYAMTRNEAGVWQYVISRPAGDTLYYRFQRAAGEEETIPPACSRSRGNTSWRWAASGFEAQVNLPVICYTACVACNQAPECSDPLALICDPFERYSLADEVSPQADWWQAVRPGEDAVITNEQAYSPPQSLLLQEGGRKQTRLQLPAVSAAGMYQITMRVLVPTGYGAGIALLPEVGIDPLYNLLWGTDAAGQAHLAGRGYALPSQLNFAYQPDRWQEITLLIDPHRLRLRAFLNKQLLDETAFTRLPEYVQLYSPNPTTRFFIDDVQIAQLSVCPENPLICEAFEWYTPGVGPSAQSTQWQFVNPEGIVDTSRAANGRQALWLEHHQNTQAQLALGGWNKGRFALEWQQFVPAGRSLGIQLRNADGDDWFALIHNRNGERSGEAILGLFERIYSYPTSKWFAYRMIIDMNVRTIDLYLNGQPIIEGYRFREKNLDQLRFFLPNDAGKGWIDAITFRRLPDLLTDVAFGVDLNRLPPNERATAFIQGSFTNWEPRVMESTNDGRFRYQARLPAGDTVAFRYTTGPGELESSETLTECGIADPAHGVNRLLIVGASSMNLGFPCFGFCSPCSNVTATTETRRIPADVTLFPNPAHRLVRIHWPGESIRQVRVFDATGTIVDTRFFAQANNRVRLALPNCPPGLYYVHITGTNHKQSKKLVVY